MILFQLSNGKCIRNAVTLLNDIILVYPRLYNNIYLITIIKKYTMAKVVSCRLSARPSCIAHDPLDNKTRSGWYAGRYNFSHGIIYKYYAILS